jgi:predicted nucleic acid-binding protein
VSVLVVDASVVVVALADDGADGDLARFRLHGESLLAPDLVDLEVTSVIRKQVVRGNLDLRRAALALDDLLDLPLERVPTARLVPRCWELRDNLTPNDAAYVALAELFRVPLLTADRRLAQAPGFRCRVEVM